MSSRYKLPLFALICAFVGGLWVSSACASVLKKLEVTEGAVELVKIRGVQLFLVKDDKIVSVKTTDTPNEILVYGTKFGKTQVICWDSKRNETILDITVVPRYWKTLQVILEDYPQIKRDISGDKIVLTGKVRSGEALKKIALVKALDSGRIIDNVALSPSNLVREIKSYLKEKDLNGIKVRVVENTLYFSGEVDDKSKFTQLTEVSKSFAKPYACDLNTSGLVIGALSKLIVDIQFIEVDKENIRNVGVTMNSPAKWSTSINALSALFSGDAGPIKSDWKAISFDGYINYLKTNHLAKTVYHTVLSTNSGESAKFQQGGTIHKEVSTQYSTGIHPIDYGFMIDTTPILLNKATIEIDIKVTLSIPVAGADESKSLDIRKYSTSSKYNIPPGESIILSGLNHLVDGETKRALPFFTYFPILGKYFGNDKSEYQSKEVLLVITVDVNRQSDQIKLDKKITEMKDFDIEPEMP